MTLPLGGLQKTSLIDFPGTLACVVFTSGCNFICPYCHNPELVTRGGDTGTPGISCEDLFLFLSRRRPVLEGVVITGGEPTLHPGLDALCFKIKNLGYRIKLDTNGSRPQRLADLIRRELVDYVAMDIKTAPDLYRRFCNDLQGREIRESVETIMAHASAYEFRTTCVRPFTTPETMIEIGRLIRGADHYVLQPCTPDGPVLSPAFFQNAGRLISRSRMEELKRTVSPYVARCSLR